MNKIKNILIFSTVGMLNLASASQNDGLRLLPEPGISAEVRTNGQEVTVTIKKGKSLIADKIEIETEKSLKLASDDYNFDGKEDFSISHLDDGMGTYTISQIYIYSSKNKKFEVLRPECGDEFINIVVSKKNRSLTNSYISDNQFKTCTVRY
jgi:phosphate-selective porin